MAWRYRFSLSTSSANSDYVFFGSVLPIHNALTRGYIYIWDNVRRGGSGMTENTRVPKVKTRRQAQMERRIQRAKERREQRTLRYIHKLLNRRGYYVARITIDAYRAYIGSCRVGLEDVEKIAQINGFCVYKCKRQQRGVCASESICAGAVPKDRIVDLSLPGELRWQD